MTHISKNFNCLIQKIIIKHFLLTLILNRYEIIFNHSNDFKSFFTKIINIIISNELLNE